MIDLNCVNHEYFLNYILEEGAKLIPLPDYQMEIRDMVIAYLSGEV